MEPINYKADLQKTKQQKKDPHQKPPKKQQTCGTES